MVMMALWVKNIVFEKSVVVYMVISRLSGDRLEKFLFDVKCSGVLYIERSLKLIKM